MKVAINDITIDPQIQLKARRLDNEIVAAYIEAIGGGAQFPPITVFCENGHYWLSDGFHRIGACRFLGQTEIEVEVRQGTKQDAMVHAAIANASHGRPMSRKEKQEAGERLIKLTNWSDREIARQLAINQSTVTRWKNSLTENDANASDENLDNSTQEIPGLIDLICGDFAEVAKKLDPQSIDVIITDPPYGREFVPLYGILAEQAAKLLKLGGSVLAMAGQSYLPEIFQLMTPHLTYHWTISYLTPGGQSPQLWQRQVNTFWKPVLWFTSGEYQGPWVGDVVKSAVNANDKRYHQWGQSESGMADLVERFSQLGDLVLDPFCGAGTTGVVALQLKRRFIGVDVSESKITTTRQRLLDVFQSENTAA